MEEYGLTIEIPKDLLSDSGLENLKQILDSKEELIKKALGADSLEIKEEDGKYSFPWVTTMHPADEVMAYTNFIHLLCKVANNSKWINSKKKEVDNEKYAFRCFLLRLGFIGDEFKADRKILLKNLDGSSAFKSGKETK